MLFYFRNYLLHAIAWIVKLNTPELENGTNIFFKVLHHYFLFNLLPDVEPRQTYLF